MEVALGLLGWSPETFWDSGMLELVTAMKGWQRAHGIQARSPMGRAEYEAFKKKDAEGLLNG